MKSVLHVEGQNLRRDLVGDGGLEVVKLHGRRLEDLGKQVQPGEFLHALRRTAQRLAGGHAVGAGEAVGLGGHAHRFHQGQAGAGHMQQGVLFAGVHGEVVFAAHGRIDELQHDVVPDAVDVAVAPVLEGKGGGFAAAFFRGPFVSAAASGEIQSRPEGRT